MLQLRHYTFRLGKCFDTITRHYQRTAIASAISSHPLGQRLDDTAEVVVIGGGVLGTSVLYHLAKKGMKNIMLLEKTELTAGSTWHAAGLCTYYENSPLFKCINTRTIKLFRELENETGQQVGAHYPGTIRLITSPKRYDEALYQQTRHGWTPTPCKVISSDEVAALHPLLNMDKVYGGLYSTDDGHVDPYSLTQAYAAGARQHGADIYLKSPVTATQQRRDGGWDVETEHGTINARAVVNCGGVWAREVGRMAGVELPILCPEHQYVVTSTVPEVEALDRELPVLRDLDGSYYLRQERTGLLIGPYESAATVQQREDWYDNGVTSGFGRELFESDVDRLAPHLERAMEICPVVAKANIQTVINGPMPATPDFRALLGPYQSLQNYWCCCGPAGGVITSAGLADILASWMIRGEPPMNVLSLNPNRYDKWITRDYVMKKTRETYGMRNHVTWPKEERPAGRPTQRVSTLYGELQKRGAQYGFLAGWERPLWFANEGDVPGFKPSFSRTNWFEPVKREHKMVTTGVGVIDLTASGKFDISGNDAAEFLDGLVAGELPEIGTMKGAFILSPKGKVMSNLSICRIARHHFFVITGAASEIADLWWIEKQLNSLQLNVTLTNMTDTMGCLGLAGPRAQDVMSKLIGGTEDVSEVFPKFAVKDMRIAGVPVRAVRASSTGELEWEFYHDKSGTTHVYSALMQAGKQYNIGDFGAYAMDTLRLEAGLPAFGKEISMDYDARESNINSSVKLEKEADFVGKEAVDLIHKEAQTRQLAFLVIDTDNDVDPNEYETIWQDDKVVGFTTSGCHSYRFDRGIAFCYLPKDLTQPGTNLEVELQGKRYPATVVTYPPVSGRIFEDI